LKNIYAVKSWHADVEDKCVDVVLSKAVKCDIAIVCFEDGVPGKTKNLCGCCPKFCAVVGHQHLDRCHCPFAFAWSTIGMVIKYSERVP